MIFPTDLTEDELQFMAMMMYSYIHTAKYRSANPTLWSIKERIEKLREDREKDRDRKNDVGVS